MTGFRPTLAVAATLLAATMAQAHEMRPAYLEIRETSPESFDVLWKVPARGALRLGLYVQLPERCQLIGERISYFSGAAYIERWKIRCPGGLVGETIAIDGLSATYTDVLVRLESVSGRTQTLRLNPSQTSFTVEATPTWLEVASAYTILGIEHILFGLDHLLFVLGLLLIVPSTWALIKTVTAFTVAHSITLGLAVTGIVNVPPGPVEASIALSIVFLGSEILRARAGHPGFTSHHPWVAAFVFGLLHGLGFAGALTEVGLPSDDIPIALLFFNVGVEIGQLAFVVMVLLLAWGLRSVPVTWPGWSKAAPAYAIGSVAAYWLIARVEGILST